MSESSVVKVGCPGLFSYHWPQWSPPPSFKPRIILSFGYFSTLFVIVIAALRHYWWNHVPGFRKHYKCLTTQCHKANLASIQDNVPISVGSGVVQMNLCNECKAWVVDFAVVKTFQSTQFKNCKTKCISHKSVCFIHRWILSLGLVMESWSIQTCKFKHMTNRGRPQAFLSLQQSNADNFISVVLSVCNRNPHETGNKIQQGAGPHSITEQWEERNRRATQVLPHKLLIILHTEKIPFKNGIISNFDWFGMCFVKQCGWDTRFDPPCFLMEMIVYPKWDLQLKKTLFMLKTCKS